MLESLCLQRVPDQDIEAIMLIFLCTPLTFMMTVVYIRIKFTRVKGLFELYVIGHLCRGYEAMNQCWRTLLKHKKDCPKKTHDPIGFPDVFHSMITLELLTRLHMAGR